MLIGAVGDAVTDFVNWGTLQIGSHFSDFLNVLNHLKSATDKSEQIKTDLAKIESQEAENETSFDSIAILENGRLVPRHLAQSLKKGPEQDRANDAYRPFLLAQAAQRIIAHFDQDEPRKYEYEEWAWLLTLLGEDEGNEDGHRRLGRNLAPHHEVVMPVRDHKHQVWSWIGQESPLMSVDTDSEPMWVLKRLMHVLERDLRRHADEKMAMRSSERTVPIDKIESSAGLPNT